MSRKREVTNEQIKVIIDLSKQRKSRREIAESVGVSKDTVYRYQKYYDCL
jgi:DNA invertase Pin-like site-specific DNA recombinase